MVVGYWPPLASQWPSVLFWFLASHSRPLRMFSWTSTLGSSAQSGGGEQQAGGGGQQARRVIRLMAKSSPTSGRE